VVEFSAFVPGPLCSAILADLGAEVIRVEAPGRGPVPAQSGSARRNERSVAIDLEKAQATQIVERLARRAQVAIDDFAPGVAKRLGIDRETLKKANPKIVCCSLSGVGQSDGAFAAAAILAALRAGESACLDANLLGRAFRAGANGVPGLGEHSREILVELGFDDAEIADFVQGGTVRS